MAHHFTESRPPLLVDLRDQRLPAAETGDYEAELAHRWAPAAGADAGSGTAPGEYPLTPVTHSFTVTAARRCLPPNAVHTVNPPDGASGLYHGVLPHITLSRASLPWDRALSSSQSVPFTEDSGTPRTPWLALLVFAAGELPADPGAEGLRLRHTRTAGTRTAREEVQRPDLEGGDVDEDAWYTIDVPPDVFTKVAPRLEELRYLAHSRIVRTVKSAAPWYGRREELREGTFAVVLGNRLPRGDGRYVAHLVSLEGWEKRLPPADAGDKPLRLFSLHAWTFGNRPAASRAGFEQTLRDLVRCAEQDPHRLDLVLHASGKKANTPGADTPLSSDPWPPSGRLKHGYVPVRYQTHSGEVMPAWYRGPLTPFTPKPLPTPDGGGTRRFRSAEQCHIFIDEQGVFDISYAAAWSLGRALALADPELAAQVDRARTHGWEDLRAAAAYLRLHPRADREALARHLESRSGPARFASVLRQGLLEHLAGGDRTDDGDDPAATAAAHSPATDARPAHGRLLSAWREPRVREVIRTRMARTLVPAEVDEYTQDLSLLCPPAPEDDLDAYVPAGTGLTWPALLPRVPFCYLVPDRGMLLDPVPPAGRPQSCPGPLDDGFEGLGRDGLRLFTVDADWLKCLQDGALSVGIGTALDEELTDGLSQALPVSTTPLTGLLLSTRLLSDYPDLIVEASGTTAALRRDMTGDVLMMLFAGVPGSLTFREPGHGIHFGSAGSPDRLAIGLRRCTVRESIHKGTPDPGNGQVFGTKLTLDDTHLRTPVSGGRLREVLDLGSGTKNGTGLLSDLSTELRKKQHHGDTFPDTLSPGQFALQLLRSPLTLDLTRRTKDGDPR
ncbi:hypothetical protein AB0E75_17195 [Streptomyces griseoviridis]|uniref:Uncharacterized protein n=1 Tax=Streptomyces griseoviridis TaxID=45398 RepID=A0A918LI66_STRGD|nr:hypothetical protein [Streptomyces niveoruber]GGS52866.1 hypothetical protein GCM10010238_47840 [Streptomyces niveoruber]